MRRWHALPHSSGNAGEPPHWRVCCGRLIDRYEQHGIKYPKYIVERKAGEMHAMLTLSSRPRSSWRRVVIALLAVPAILIGLLAMHFLASESLAPESHSMTASAADSPMVAVAHNEAPAPVGCDEMCAPTHDMLGMACVLALLVSADLIIFHVFLFRFRTLGAALRQIVARLSALAPPAPPSLHVLSISRT